MANRFGLGVTLDIDLPGARTGLMPTREWRAGQGKAWNIGDTIVCGIGQGYIQATPLSLATMVGAHRHRPRRPAACHPHHRRRAAARLEARRTGP